MKACKGECGGQLLCWSCCFLSNAPICGPVTQTCLNRRASHLQHALPPPMPESSQADSRHKNGDQSPDVKSYQVQYYHQTYIIKIMDITAYFLSLLSDWLERALPLVGFFGGRVWIANRGLSTGIHTGLGHIQRDNGSDSVPIVALPLPDRTRAIYICSVVSLYLSAISSYVSRVLCLQIVNIRGWYSALSWECCYHLLRLLLRVSHKQGSQFRPEWWWERKKGGFGFTIPGSWPQTLQWLGEEKEETEVVGSPPLLTWISHSLFIHRPSSLWSAGSESAVNNSNYCIIAATSIVLNSLWSPQCLWSLTHLIIMPMNVKKGDQSHNFKITWMWTRNQSAGPGKLKTVWKVWECCKCKVWVSPRSMLVVWESPFKCNFPVIAHFQIK